MAYENVAVPFQTWGNCEILTRLQVCQMPFLMDFIRGFPACFEYDAARAIWVFYPEGDAPVTNGE